jgi:hypothetical protein
MCLADRPVLESNAAGVDVGAREMFVAVPPGRDDNPVRVFTTFTDDLERLADWLAQCGVTTVAMESNGGSIGFRCTTFSSTGASARVWSTRGIESKEINNSTAVLR